MAEPIEAESRSRQLDPATAAAARTFLCRLTDSYVFADAFVYGSRARGDHTPESDPDVAVILKGTPGDRFKVGGDLSDIAYDVLLETGIHIQALPLSEDEWRHSELFSNPALVTAIKRDGLQP